MRQGIISKTPAMLNIQQKGFEHEFCTQKRKLHVSSARMTGVELSLFAGEGYHDGQPFVKML